MHSSTERFDDKSSRQRSVRRTVRFTPAKLRIVAGFLGGRRIQYNGDPDTRPMKEKTREAVFSLLGGYLEDTIAIDLFAGTGILAFEAISRGAEAAVLLELSRPTVSVLLANMRLLGLDEHASVQNVDTLRWLRHAADRTSDLSQNPWVVFCCPPYALWREKTGQLMEGLENLIACAPVQSRFVCETESKFDLTKHLSQFVWDVRDYKPAKIAICTKG